VVPGCEKGGVEAILGLWLHRSLPEEHLPADLMRHEHTRAN